MFFPIQMHREANLYNPLSPINQFMQRFSPKASSMIAAKVQPQCILGSGEEDFERFLPYTDMAAILVNES